MTTDPFDTTAQLQRASALNDLHRYAEAEVMLKDAIRTAPDHFRCWCSLALAQIGLSKDADALVSSQRAIALSPDAEWPYRLESLALSRLGRHDEALEAARTAVRLDPHSWRTLIRLAQACCAVDAARSEARGFARQAVELAPLEPQTHIALGSVAIAQGDAAAAQAALARALELDPDSAEAHNELARLHLRHAPRIFGAQSLADAARGFATALTADPASEGIRRNLDLVVRKFLFRAAYLIMVVALIVFDVFAQHTEVADRVLPLLLLVVPGLFVVRFVSNVSPDIRRYLRRAVLTPPTRLVGVVVAIVAIVLLFVGAVAPEGARDALAVAAGVCALSSRILVAYDHRDGTP